MHLFGRGYEEENGRREFMDTTLVWLYPDEKNVRKLAEMIGIPQACVNKVACIEVGKKKAMPEKAHAMFAAAETALKKAGIEVVDPKRTEICSMAKARFDGGEYKFGFQAKNDALYALVSGKCEISWPKVPRIDYGVSDAKALISRHTEEICLYDLQCGSDTCYTADEFRCMDGKRIILLYGNGWEDEGFPHDPASKHYPGIMGKTAENMRAFFGRDRIPDFLDVYSGNLGDLVEWTFAEKEDA